MLIPKFLFVLLSSFRKQAKMATPPQKAFEKAHTIWDTVQTFQVGMKAFGFACFTIVKPISSGKIKSTFFDILWFIIICLITIYLIYLNCIYKLSLIITTSRVINVGSRGVLLFEVCNVLFSCILMFIRRRDVRKFVDKMAALNLLIFCLILRFGHVSNDASNLMKK